MWLTRKLPVKMECFCGKSKTINCQIIFLDDHTYDHQIKNDDNGQTLLDVAFAHLNLMETAYFGLRYLDQRNQTHWLNPVKKLRKQFNWNSVSDRNRSEIPTYVLYFSVKFYAVDPCKLIEELTRYQFFLQIKQDILQGRLPVSFELAAELGGYIVQSELGDYDARQHKPGYLSEFRFLHNQTVELETRVAEYHRLNAGMLPSTAELNYLDKVKWLELYGVDLHSVLGEDNVDYFLGLTPSGIVVLRNTAIVGNYYWPRISKIHFKGCYFMLRVTDKNNDENTYGFETPSKAACKHLWKCCLEHHAFFRLYQVSPGSAADIFGLGSRFRFSGRTEKQATQDAKMCTRNPPTFCRTLSRRRNVDSNEDKKNEFNQNREIKIVSIPQPVQMPENPYRSVSTLGTSRPDGNGAESPSSMRSVPWSQSQRGLYGTGTVRSPSSPRSVRSHPNRQRSSSVDSHSSNDSRHYRRHKHHHSRATSDNESELSKNSARSHRRHRRSSAHRRSTGSDLELNQDKSKYGDYKLVESESQWKEVQRQQQILNGKTIQQASIVHNRRSSVGNSCHESESEMSYRHSCSRRHRKHRSRSRSPASGKAPWLSDELKKHFEFDLIDTTGMTQSQLREIPYTVVKTSQAKQIKLKHAMANKKNMLANVKPYNWMSYNDKMDGDERNEFQVGLIGTNHEHTDSGLGGEQDYDERWVQSKKHELGLHLGGSEVAGPSGEVLERHPSSVTSPSNGHPVSKQTNPSSKLASETLPSHNTKLSSFPTYASHSTHSAYNNTYNTLASRGGVFSNSADTSSLNSLSKRLTGNARTAGAPTIMGYLIPSNGSYMGSLGRVFVHRDGPLRLQQTNQRQQQRGHNSRVYQVADDARDRRENPYPRDQQDKKGEGPGEMSTEL